MVGITRTSSANRFWVLRTRALPTAAWNVRGDMPVCQAPSPEYLTAKVNTDPSFLYVNLRENT